MRLPFKGRRPSPAMGVAFLALILAVSGTAVALPGKNLISSDDIKKGAVKNPDIARGAVTSTKLRNGAVSTGKLRNDAVTGEKVNEGSLGPVPNAANATNATNAQNATQLGGTAASGYAKTEYEGVHLVGAPGEPAFGAGWSNFGGGFAPAGFYKDPLGIVHLQGLVNTGPGAVAFTLPEGYRPSTNHYQIVAEGGAGEAHVTVSSNGAINVFNYAAASFVSFEYINFRVGT
jgi:hypothetical protein